MKRNQIPYFSKNCTSSVPTVLSSNNGDTTTNPYVLRIPLMITFPVQLELQTKA